jgi:hypothetical protein
LPSFTLNCIVWCYVQFFICFLDFDAHVMPSHIYLRFSYYPPSFFFHVTVVFCLYFHIVTLPCLYRKADLAYYSALRYIQFLQLNPQ